MSSDSDSQTADYVRDNTWKIVDEAENFHGSCFFIEVNGFNYCVTCHHCIWKLDKIFAQIGGNDRISLKWLNQYSDPSKDIAVLSVNEKSQINPLKYEPKALPELPIYVMGWPVDRINDIDTACQEDESNLSKVSIGIKIREETMSGTNNPWNIKPKGTVNLIGFKGNYNLGLSGSPVCYKVTNNVVGIFTAIDDYVHGYALPIETLLQVFDKDKLALPFPNVKSSEYLVAGNDYFKKKEYERAIEQYNNVIKDLNYVNAMCNKGRALGNLNRLHEEREWYKKVLAIDPINIRALNGMGASLLDSGELEQAQNWIEKALEHDANDKLALYNKGLALDKLGRYQDAIIYYDKALAVDPNYFDALNNKGYVLERLGLYQDAIEWYDKALTVDPNEFDALYNMALVLDQLGQYDDAIVYYDKALAVDPNYFEAWYNKGLALYMKGYFVEAIECFDRALVINPNDLESLNNKGVALQYLGKFEDAIEWFDKALAIDSNFTLALSNKDMSLEKLGKIAPKKL